MSLRVTSAVYGALRDGGQDNTEASIVKNALQERLTGALCHGLFVARRSGDGCAPGTVHGTWVG
jgi:hypothetical protein